MHKVNPAIRRNPDQICIFCRREVGHVDGIRIRPGKRRRPQQCSSCRTRQRSDATA